MPDGLFARVQRTPLRAVPVKVIRAVARAMYSAREMRIYRQEPVVTLAPTDLILQRDNWGDLALYAPAESGDPSKDEFLHHARLRRDAGAHVYSTASHGILEHFSWLMTGGEQQGVKFLEGFALPQESAFLWDDYTHPSARGRGLHSTSLRRRIADAGNDGVAWAYISVRSDNVPSRRNIERAGFHHYRSIHTTRLLGRTTIRFTPAA